MADGEPRCPHCGSALGVAAAHTWVVPPTMSTSAPQIRVESSSLTEADVRRIVDEQLSRLNTALRRER